MSRRTRLTGAFALAAMLGFTAIGAMGSGAFAQDETLGTTAQQPSDQAVADTSETSAVRFVSEEIVQPLPGEAGTDDDRLASDASSLTELVDSIELVDGEMSKDMECLAGAIYFESRGEPLEGQLAVGRVIVNRAESDRFPSSYCGVVYQRSQFSFVRGGRMPAISTSSDAWRKAKAVARIAHEGLWDSPAKGALFFHASYVKPRWRLTRVGQVSNHVFYR